jgi:hypothetical protein
MFRQIQHELAHIPASKESPQGELRMIYWKHRVQSLKRGENEKSRGEVLRDAMASVRQSLPAAEFTFDAIFFE